MYLFIYLYSIYKLFFSITLFLEHIWSQWYQENTSNKSTRDKVLEKEKQRKESGENEKRELT